MDCQAQEQGRPVPILIDEHTEERRKNIARVFGSLSNPFAFGALHASSSNHARSKEEPLDEPESQTDEQKDAEVARAIDQCIRSFEISGVLLNPDEIVEPNDLPHSESKSNATTN